MPERQQTTPQYSVINQFYVQIVGANLFLPQSLKPTTSCSPVCPPPSVSVMFLDSPIHFRIPFWLAWEEKLDYSIHFHRKCRLYTMIRLAHNLRQITLPVPPVRYVEFFSPVYSLINTFTAIVDLSRFNNSCLKSRQRRP